MEDLAKGVVYFNPTQARKKPQEMEMQRRKELESDGKDGYYPEQEDGWKERRWAQREERTSTPTIRLIKIYAEGQELRLGSMDDQTKTLMYFTQT